MEKEIEQKIEVAIKKPQPISKYASLVIEGQGSESGVLHYNLLKKIKFTEEQKEQIKLINNRIFHVHFKWGGQGYITVSQILMNFLIFSNFVYHFAEEQNKVSDHSACENFARQAQHSQDNPGHP